MSVVGRDKVIHGDGPKQDEVIHDVQPLPDAFEEDDDGDDDGGDDDDDDDDDGDDDDGDDDDDWGVWKAESARCLGCCRWQTAETTTTTTTNYNNSNNNNDNDNDNDNDNNKRLCIFFLITSESYNLVQSLRTLRGKTARTAQ